MKHEKTLGPLSLEIQDEYIASLKRKPAKKSLEADVAVRPKKQRRPSRVR